MRERYLVGKEHPSIAALRVRFPEAYYGSAVCISPGLVGKGSLLHQMTTDSAADDVWVGYSRLGTDAFVAKVIDGDSPSLRQQIAVVRRNFQAAAGVSAPALRRITGEVAS